MWLYIAYHRVSGPVKTGSQRGIMPFNRWPRNRRFFSETFFPWLPSLLSCCLLCGVHYISPEQAYTRVTAMPSCGISSSRYCSAPVLSVEKSFVDVWVRFFKPMVLTFKRQRRMLWPGCPHSAYGPRGAECVKNCSGGPGADSLSDKPHGIRARGCCFGDCLRIVCPFNWPWVV